MDKLHDNAMTVEVDRFWNWKTPIVEGLHVGKLFGGRDPRQIQPAHLLPLLVVVPFLANLSETSPTKAVQLQTQLLALLVGHDVDVRLLARPDLVAEGFDGVAAGQGLERQVVVAGIGEPVPTVAAAASLILEKSVFAQLLKDFRSSSSNCSNRNYQGLGHELVVFHPHLHSRQDSQLVPSQVPQQ